MDRTKALEDAAVNVVDDIQDGDMVSMTGHHDVMGHRYADNVYGFNPSLAGINTPITTNGIGESSRIPVLDTNGLGWPGELYSLRVRQHSFIYNPAKSTISRLNASTDEVESRKEKLSAAVKTILECIGEDPEREGLVRTPERYAQALLWMTKGYEERLSGEYIFAFFFKL